MWRPSGLWCQDSFPKKTLLAKGTAFWPSCRTLPTPTRVHASLLEAQLILRSLTPYTLWFGFVVGSMYSYTWSLVTDFATGLARTLDRFNSSRSSLHPSLVLVIVTTALVLQVQRTRSILSSDCFPAAGPAYTLCPFSAIQMLSCCIDR